MSEEQVIELTGESDDEEYLDSITDRTTLRNEGRQKVESTSWKKTLCKALVILTASIIFFAVLLRSWQDYGTYITQHVFPPKIYSMSVQCEDRQSHFFNSPTCTWSRMGVGEDVYTRLACTLDKPSNYIVHTSHTCSLLNTTWEDNLYITYKSNITNCVDLTIWSI